MVTGHLDDRELQLLIVALRYWRSHRAGGVARRTDPPIPPDTVDLLLAKLSASVSTPLQPSTLVDPAEIDLARLDG
ncbi:MAG: hypothetical protein AB7O32_00935 [Vicinamibacterales bacterium]